MTARLTRRAALLMPAALLSGCSLMDSWFGNSKPRLPGKRESIGTGEATGLKVDLAHLSDVTLPSPVENRDWPQPGGDPAHVMGNLAGERYRRLWSSAIGEGTGYRQRITSRPIVVGGRVYAMDADAVVTGYDLTHGRRLWRTETQGKKDRSFNVGGGIASDGRLIYAATGRAEVLALDPASGAIRWRNTVDAPARAAPTVAGGRLYFPTIEDQLLALSVENGSQVWSYQAQNAATSMLGQPSPAVSADIVVAGFGSGDLAALRSDTGSTVWTDTLASSQSADSLAAISAIRGLPVIDNERVYAIGLGGLMLCLDLRSGRRLWERDVGGSETPWVAGEWVFVLTDQQQLAALHRDDGHARWIADLPDWKNPQKGEGPIYWVGPVMMGGRLVVMSSDRQMIALDARNGRDLGWQKLQTSISLTPIVAQARLLSIGDDGQLAAYG